MSDSRLDIHDRMTVGALRTSRMMSLGDLQDLLEASDMYMKFRSYSERATWTMCVNCNCEFELQLPNETKPIRIKVSTYHDVKEVKWDLAEKQTIVRRKMLVMGTKMKEENWKDRSYSLRYWMIFEIQPPGDYTTEIPSVDNWEAPFKKAKPDGFEYQHIKEKKKYGNVIIRRLENGDCLFQVNYHIWYDGRKALQIPMKSNIPTVRHEYEYLGLQDMMKKLHSDIRKQLGQCVLEYPEFLKKMRAIFQNHNCTVKRLDSFVL